MVDPETGALEPRGEMIGQEARKDIEALMEMPVMLRPWVKVRPVWTNNPAALKRMGYDQGH